MPSLDAPPNAFTENKNSLPAKLTGLGRVGVLAVDTGSKHSNGNMITKTNGKQYNAIHLITLVDHLQVLCWQTILHMS